jgi:hypothetical protein
MRESNSLIAICIVRSIQNSILLRVISPWSCICAEHIACGPKLCTASPSIMTWTSSPSAMLTPAQVCYKRPLVARQICARPLSKATSLTVMKPLSCNVVTPHVLLDQLTRPLNPMHLYSSPRGGEVRFPLRVYRVLCRGTSTFLRVAICSILRNKAEVLI